LRRLEFLSAFKEEMCGRYRRTTQEEELARPSSTHSEPNECRVTIKEQLISMQEPDRKNLVSKFGFQNIDEKPASSHRK
jgi:hypothetical protein